MYSFCVGLSIEEIEGRSWGGVNHFGYHRNVRNRKKIIHKGSRPFVPL